MVDGMCFAQSLYSTFLSGARRPGGSVACWLTFLFLLPVPGARSFAEEAAPISISELNRAEPVDFETEILPILQKNCLACHNASDAESDLVLETPQTIRQGGSLGPAVVPGGSEESLLLLVSAHREEPLMPPVDNERGADPLTPDELGLIKKWIDEGAEGTVGERPESLTWQPISPQFQPILATAISRDGQYLACGRGNRLFVYHWPTRQLVARLVDPDPLNNGTGQALQVAHLDMVQSLAFSPRENLLASGGFRTVKLWRRAPHARLSETDLDVMSDVSATSGDARWFASGDSNGSIRLLDVTGPQELRLLEGHAGGLTALVFSSDSRWLVSAAADNLRIWNVAEGRQVGQLVVPAAQVLAVLDQGKQIITTGTDNIIRVWAAPHLAVAGADDTPPVSGEEVEGDAELAPLRELNGHGAKITALATLPGAPGQLVSGSLDGTLRHWDAQQGSEIRKLDTGSPVTALAVRPDGERFSSVGQDHVVKLWNATDGKLLAEFKGDQRLQVQMVRADQQVQLAEAEVAHHKTLQDAAKKQVQESQEASKKSNEARVTAETEWGQVQEDAQKLEQKKVVADQELAAAGAILEGLAALEKLLQEYVAEGSEQDQALLAQFQVTLQAATSVVEAEKGPVETLTAQLEEATIKVQAAEKKKNDALTAEKSALAAVEKAEQKTLQADQELAAAEGVLAGCQEDKKKTSEESEASHARVTTVAFSPDNSYLAWGDAERRIQLVDALSGNLFVVFDDHADPIHTVRFTVGSNLVSLSAQGKRVVRELQPEWVLERTIGNVDQSDQLVDRVLALDFSPDGKLLATGSGEATRSGELKIWQVADGQLVRTIDPAHSDTVFGVEFSPDGKVIASSAADRLVKTFQVASGELIRSFEGHTHHALDVAWQANGRRLVSAGADHVIKVWDAGTGVQQRTISGYPKEITSIAFLGIGSQAVATSGDSTVRLHNTDDGAEIRKLEGGEDFVYTAVASLSGELVVAGGRDGVLRAWNVQDGKLRGSFAPPEPAKE